MRRTVKRVLPGVLTIALSALAAPAAHASGHVVHGGCFMLAASSDPVADNPPETGIIGDVSVTTDSAGNPIGATVFCKVQVDGVDTSFPASSFASPVGSGVEIGVGETLFSALDNDTATICERVLYDDGADTGYHCRSVIEASAPPQVVPDLLDSTVFQPVVDPNLCPVLESNPGTYAGGLVEVQPEGDVYLPNTLTGPIYDCPPYGDFSIGAPVNTDRSFHTRIYFAPPPTT